MSSVDTPKGREIRAALQKACAIAHGRGAGLSANELMALVLEEGLPSREVREQLLLMKLKGDDERGDNTTPSSAPS